MMLDYAELSVPAAPYTLYLSSRPGFGLGAGWDSIEEFTAHFSELGVKTVMVLITAPEINNVYGGELLSRYRKAGFRVMHCPVEDFSIPSDMESFAECIDELWRALHHGRALMHCAAGLGRTGIAASCILVRSGEEWQKALDLVRDVRPGAAQTSEQEEFIARYARYLDRSR